MDYHKILMLLTSFDENAKTNIIDEQLKIILDDVIPHLSENDLNQVLQNENIITVKNHLGDQYLSAVLYTIKKLCDDELSGENPLLTVNQFKVIKTAIELATCIGIIPSLLPQIKIHASNTKLKTFKLNFDEDSILEKHKRLVHTTSILLECYNAAIIRPAILAQLDCLLAALLQIAHAPLKKPNVQSTSNSDFQMTNKLYSELKEEQEKFKYKLYNFMENCPDAMLIKEMMVILGVKNNPKWLQASIKHYLMERIMMPNGIVALAFAICDEISDLGKCWDKLDVTARLVATSHGSDAETYYASVCSQIVEMLTPNDNRQGIIIANSCIKALYDYKPNVCVEKVVHVIMEPFLIKNYSIQSNSNIIKTENEVSRCVENLCKLFITSDAEFKCLPTKLLTLVALPLFYLYIQSHKSVYIHRNQVRQLLLKMLLDESLRDTIYTVFLNHQNANSDEYGKKLCFCFGKNGGIEISSEQLSVEYEEITDYVYNLVSKDGQLSFHLFTYLLKILPKLNNLEQSVQKGKLLESTADTMERIEKQLTTIKLLTVLSSSTSVQEAQMKDPKPILDFIKFFFSKVLSNFESNDELAYEQDTGVLYTSLMLIKLMITGEKVYQSWQIFQDFILSVRQEYDFKKLPEHVVSIFEEIEIIVKRKGKSYSKNYCDLSADSKNLSEVDKALADLADPLLPVRAHGIIALTKLIERRHPDVILKKDLLLCVFRENLAHDDSFIYLAAINGVSAMSTMFADKVIEILVQEFIDMTQQTKSRDITPETRAKLGEILVKTTRSLGEMTPKYKSLLVNGFLSGVRDPDPLVRASSLSCLGEFCKIMGFRLGDLIIEILYCIGCIIKTDTDDGCRRAGVLVATLLLRGLGKDALSELGANLITLYRSLKHLRDNDKDPILRLHAQLALEEFDDIVQKFLFAKPKLEKSIFLLSN